MPLAVVCLHCSFSFPLAPLRGLWPWLLHNLFISDLRTAVRPSLSLPFSRRNKPSSLSLFSYIMYSMGFRAPNISCASNTLPKEAGNILWRKASPEDILEYLWQTTHTIITHTPNYATISVMQSSFLIGASKGSESQKLMSTFPPPSS